MVVKSVGVLSVGKVFGALYVLIGLIAGAVLSLLSLAGAAAGGRDAGPAAMLFGVGAVIIIPIFYGIIGFIGGLIVGAFYNVVASVAGGLEITLERTSEDYRE